MNVVRHKLGTTVGVALACVLTVAMLLAGCGSSSSSALSSPAGHATVHAPNSLLAEEAMASAVPVDYQDVNAGALFTSFEQSVQDRATDSCMQADGLPDPQMAPPVTAGGGNDLYFPDFAALEQGEWVPPGTKATPDPVTHMSFAERKAFVAAELRCSKRTGPLLRPINLSVNELAGDWQNVIQQVDSEPAVSAGLTTKFAACTRAAGVDAATPQQFIDVVAETTTPLYSGNKQAEGNIQSVRLGRIYGRCLGPTQALRQSILRTRRGPFLSSHYALVQKIDEQAQQVVTQLGREYHVAVQSKLPAG